MANTSSLPKYRSHKTVHAAKIIRVEGDQIRLEIPLPHGGPMGGEDFNEMTVKAAPNMFARYMPVAGDYYVVYDDGYASISPKQAFEEGYHRL